MNVPDYAPFRVYEKKLRDPQTTMLEEQGFDSRRDIAVAIFEPFGARLFSAVAGILVIGRG